MTEQEELDSIPTQSVDLNDEPAFVDMVIMDNLNGIVIIIDGQEHELNYEDAKFLARAIKEELESSDIEH